MSVRKQLREAEIMIAKLWRALMRRRKVQEASILKFLMIHHEATIFMIARGTELSSSIVQIRLGRMVNDKKLEVRDVPTAYGIAESMVLGRYHDLFRISDAYKAAVLQTIKPEEEIPDLRHPAA
jgi:hypothetical protein